MPDALPALTAANTLGGSTILRYLPQGARFRFVNSETTHTNLGRGWYADESGHRYRTGLNTAVIAAN